MIVLMPMVLNAHAGTKYGIPFPVYCRASFGILGANVPALLRALVACGWFGIQSWIGGWAIYKIVAIAIPAWEQIAPIPWLNINMPQLGCFLAFWAINMLVIYLGIDSIRMLLNIKAPLSDRAGAGTAWRGPITRRTASGRCSRSRRSLSPRAPRPASSGRSSSRP